MKAPASISKNGTKPAYQIGGRWVWVGYPALGIVGENYPYDEGYEGFTVEVLMNPTGYEERNLQLALREYLQRLRQLSEEAIAEKRDADQDLIDAAEDEYFRAVAPRVRGWNAEQDGVHVPAPGETDDPEAFRAFYVVPAHLKQWTAAVVREITVPKRRTPPSSPAGTTAIAIPSSIVPEQEHPNS